MTTPLRRLPPRRLLSVALLLLLSVSLRNIFLLDRPNFVMSNDPPKTQFTTNFVFPSEEERLKYYMGDWFGRNLTPNDTICKGIPQDARVGNTDVLFSARYMRTQLESRYLKSAFHVLNHTGINPENNNVHLLMVKGDWHSHSTEIPSVAKTRFSRFATSKTTGEPFFNTIIWPLSMNRHYSPVDEYTALLNEGKVPKWEEKKASLVWRGGLTGIKSDKSLLSNYVYGGPRIQAVRAHFHGNLSDVDVSPHNNHSSLPNGLKDVRNLSRGRLSMEDQLRFKYILSIEGNDVSTGLKWQLASNSVVFMPMPMTVSFAMEDLLVPFVHYVPVKDDFSDLIEMVDWARKNDDKCKWISEQATLFMENLWVSEKAKKENEKIEKKLALAYLSQFQEALNACAKPKGNTIYRKSDEKSRSDKKKRSMVRKKESR